MVKKQYRNKFVTASLAASLVATAGYAVQTEASTPAFNDIEGNIHVEAIKKLSEQGVISGFGDGTFRPDEYVTRGEFCTIFYILDLVNDGARLELGKT